MGCITSKAITRSMSIREELRHGFQSRSVGWEELLTSTKLKTTTYTSPANAETAPDSCKFTLRENDLKDGKRSLSFHTVEEYDALLDRIRAQESNSSMCDVEMGWKRKAAARGLKSLDIRLPAIASLRQKMVGIYSPGTYVTPKFGSYNAPTITMPQNETHQNTLFSPDLLAAFEDCMQQLQLEEDTILKHMLHYSFQNEVASSSNML